MTLAIGAAIGLVGGFIGGMLGIGGGVIWIPSLVLLGIAQHTAQGISLAVVTVTTSLGALVQYRQGNVKSQVALWVAPSAALFSFFGAALAGLLDAQWLGRIFGLLLLAVGARMALGR